MTHPAYGQLRPVTETASVLLCDNPGLMTLDGTNTWELRARGSDEIVSVDAGGAAAATLSSSSIPDPTTTPTSNAWRRWARCRWC